MTVTQLIILILIGLLSGFSSGLLGIGGAVILIPGMIFLLGMSQHSAQGTSLAVLLLPVGIFATMNYYKAGYVNFKFAAVIIVTFIIGSYLGSTVAVHIQEKMLNKIFALLLLFIGVKMFFTK